jgi:hypothetical protein
LPIDDAGNKTILGFYRLSLASVDFARTLEILQRGLARHDVPGFVARTFSWSHHLPNQSEPGTVFQAELLRVAQQKSLPATA